MTQSTSFSGRGDVVAGLFHDAGQGDRALTDLKAAGFARVEISQADPGNDAADLSPTTREDAYDVAQGKSAVSAATANAGTSPFFQEHESAASSFFDELVQLGFSQHDAHDLVDGLVKGNALVTAEAGANLDRAVDILKQYDADIRYAAAVGVAPQAQPNAAAVPVAATDADRELQLRAERLVVNKQRVQHGEARIRKEIVTEMKSFDVPVSHEELVIEHHAVSGEGAIDSEPIAEATIRIPLTEEKVTIGKETIVKEEVEIGTRRVERLEHVSDTVRHEELRVNDPTTPPGTASTP